MPPVPIARGGLRVSKPTSTSRWTRTRSSMSAVRSIDLGPQRRTHAEQADEAFGFLDAPVGGLRVGCTLRMEQSGRTHRDGVDAAAARFEHHLAFHATLG